MKIREPNQSSRLKHIPKELRERAQWVGFKIRKTTDGTTKTPYIADDPGRKASSTNPRTWRPFDVAQNALNIGHFDAIAFCLNGEGIVGIDLDDCITKAGLNDFAKGVVSRCGSYVERSFSGAGVHVIVKGVLPGKGRDEEVDGHKVEVYDRARFWICTGDTLPKTQRHIVAGQQVVDWLLGLMDGLTERAENPEAICSASLCPSLSFSVNSDRMEVEQVTRATLPEKARERNNCIMKLARGLRFNADMAATPLRELKPIVRTWHEVALPNIGTKEFDPTWKEFVHAWNRARLPLGVDPVRLAWDRIQGQVSGGVVEEYDTEPVRKLVALLREMVAVTGNRVIWVATRKAGELIGVSRTKVSEFYEMLEADGVLERVAPGTTYRATRYRWIGRPHTEVRQ